MAEDAGKVLDLLKRGGFEAAERLLSEAVRDSSVSLDALHNLAVARYKLGQFEDAAAAGRRALADHPHSSRTRYLLGLILKDAGRIDEAADLFSELIESSPDVPQPYYHRGTCHFLRGRVAQAADDLERAVTLDPLNLVGHYNLGVVHVADRRWEKARHDFTACLRIDPSGAEEYAQLLVEIGRAQVCERVYGQGHRLKNMLGIVGDRMKRLIVELRSRFSPGERREADGLLDQQGLIFADLAAFLNTLQPSPLELDLTDVHDLLDRALFTASPSIAHLTVRKRMEDTPEIVCDVESIHETFLNVILNAAEAMPDGGVLEVSAAPDGEEHVTVRFRNTGPAIPREDLSRIFQFGYSTRSFGSGLGLSQARAYLAMHGGTITAENLPEGGVVFTIRLPLSPEILPSVQDLKLRPVLFEELRELMMELPEDEQLLII